MGAVRGGLTKAMAPPQRHQDGQALTTTTTTIELSPLVTALLAVAVVITVAQLLGQLADRLGQPRVLGDIVGGILLGPSLLGALQPQLSAWLFSPAVRTQLNLLGQLGLVLTLDGLTLCVLPLGVQPECALETRPG
jgi:hypothetical protein